MKDEFRNDTMGKVLPVYLFTCLLVSLSTFPANDSTGFICTTLSRSQMKKKRYEGLC